MLDRRMIGTVVYGQYSFRALGASCRDLYTLLVLYADNDGVCDRIPDIMDLYKSSPNDLRSLMSSGFVLPLKNENRPDIVVWLPDFLRFNVIHKTKGYAPSIYRDALRERYPWAPLLIVRDNKNVIRTDVINDNDNLMPDPRTGIEYTTPSGQKQKIKIEEVTPRVHPGLPLGDSPHKKNKLKKNKLKLIDYDDEEDALLTKIKKQVQYDQLLLELTSVTDRDLLSDVIADIVDVYTITSPDIKIGSERYPTTYVHERYDHIDYDLVLYVVRQLRDVDIRKNAKQYIRTTTFNALTSRDTQYLSDARHGR